ncbi:PIG-L family deacetylase [Promicromonospora soli]|uniref:1D-myo-inositol 2-acetamido-2-deoxy-alpha-D-glucopyranoside deacetylase n=1 Tax=Promicromonospora soli TaxID=2035533 RepID=A0A919KZE1_9MICO|nr:PIG-L family deacetylase [Promicromonospora soli]GHH78252.1 1D-myo-inositol 2-acetamido-2-deoxy-alpha-D-glucopyranoside deacetylase [Promicromonospora soli]
MTIRLPGEDPALSAFSGPAAFGGLLAVHAHPDDETLSTGGLLATWAAAGQPVCLVTCTRGERGEVIALPGTTSEGQAHLEGDGPALGAYRETELARALAELGGGDVGTIKQTFLDALPLPDPQVTAVPHAPDTSDGVRYEDSGMSWVAPGVAGPAPDSPPTAFARVPLDESAGRLAALIRARRPAVVVTYEPSGGYGHPDHVRAHELTVRALELAADQARPEPWAGAELWQAVAPAAEVREARATLAAHPAARILAATEALTFAPAHEPLPPLARGDLAAWSAGRQEIGSSDYRSPDAQPITRADGVVRVDVRTVVGRVVGAMRAHATQVQHATALVSPVGPVAGWYALSNNVLAPVLTHETYLVTPPR